MAIEFDVQPERVGEAEQSRYFDAKIDALRAMIAARPAPSTIYEGLQWQRKFMAHYGKVCGAIEHAVHFKQIPLAMGRALEGKIKTMIHHHLNVLLIGGG